MAAEAEAAALAGPCLRALARCKRVSSHARLVCVSAAKWDTWNPLFDALLSMPCDSAPPLAQWRASVEAQLADPRKAKKVRALIAQQDALLAKQGRAPGP